MYHYSGPLLNPAPNKQIKFAAARLGPPLRRLFCALIAQNNQLRYGPLFGRYALST